MTKKENSNNGKIILAGAFIAAAGVAIYKMLNFDLTIGNPTKGEYYKDDPIDDPQVEDGSAEYIREIAPQV